jgi:hypothetical protein
LRIVDEFDHFQERSAFQSESQRYDQNRVPEPDNRNSFQAAPIQR